jgi:uncharacterized repeat protein (TIGR01451 family)
MLLGIRIGRTARRQRLASWLAFLAIGCGLLGALACGAGSGTPASSGPQSVTSGTTPTGDYTITIASSFGAPTIPLNATTSLKFTLASPNATVGLTGVGFTDTLPSGLVVATPNSLTGSCGGGTITAAAGSTSITLAGAALSASSNCTFTVNVTGISAGVENNVTSRITSSQGATGNSASSSLTVVAPPRISSTFAATSLLVGRSTALSFTISNPNATISLTGVGFTDELPSGLAVATPNGYSGNCGQGIMTAAAGSAKITLTGAALGTSSGCTFTLNVAGISAGLEDNVTSMVTSSQGGKGNSASSSLTVVAPAAVAPPRISTTFAAISVPIGGSTALSFSISNPNAATSLTGVGFTDALPSGLLVATPNGSTGSCGGGTIIAAPGSNSITLSGAALGTSSSCTFMENVTGISAGVEDNVTSMVTSSQGGNGNAASSSLTVVAPPSISSLFSASTVPMNQTISLTFSIANPNNTVTLAGVSLTDSLPSGLTAVSATSGCGGGVTAVSNNISLSGASIPPDSACSITATIQGSTAGLWTNTSSPVTSTNGGTGNTTSEGITVVAPPTIASAFGAPTLLVGDSTNLQFTITNPNTTMALSEVGFTDALPAGLLVSTPNGLTGTCGGGVIAAGAGSSSLNLVYATLPGLGSCTFSVSVTGTAVGSEADTTSAITSLEGGDGNEARATLTVLTPVLVNYFSNANTSGAPDATARIINTGTSSLGNVCADIFVFDAQQEMSECCSCMLTPDNLLTLSVNDDLTANPVTDETLTSGMIEVISVAPQAGSCPLPVTIASAPTLRAWVTHLQHGTTGYVSSETESQVAGATAANLSTLQTECSAIQTLGSGNGICANSNALAIICNN